MAKLFNFNPFKSMTLKGTAIAVVGYVWSHVDYTSAASPAIGFGLQAVGFFLGMLGIRNAIAKNGTQQ
jgi:hypothetical protein